MTDTEKILSLLEINVISPSAVVDKDSLIISCNHPWLERFGSSDAGKTFYNIFDKNTKLLVKNCFLDAQTFDKVQRRTIQIETEESIFERKILISPFKLGTNEYYYILIYNEFAADSYLVYPTLDFDNIDLEYTGIISQLKNTIPTTIIDKKNLQFSLDIEKEPLAILGKNLVHFKNKFFNKNYNIKEPSKQISFENVFNPILTDKINIASNELYLTRCSFVIENLKFDPSISFSEGRVILFPIIDKNEKVTSILMMGNILGDEFEETTDLSEEVDIEDTENVIELVEDGETAQVIYDKNNFDILDVNQAASDLYGYSINVLREMSMTQLFSPESMQKLLVPLEKTTDALMTQITNSGNQIEVRVERKDFIWEGKEVRLETIFLNQPEEEVIELDEFSESKNSETAQSKVESIESENDPHSNFLSNLFHELLTPVNVILGFVQEIIDSIDKPSEEQEESAQIIKDNQQILLQAMNTAVQYAQLDENKIDLSLNEFDINNYLVDLQDSFFRISGKENVNVVFEGSSDQLIIHHDKSKLLAAISYFIKFVIQLTESSEVFITFKSLANKFSVNVKDSEKEISPRVLADMLEIYNPSSPSDKKNYEISPIAIKLARKLNELLEINITELSDTEGEKCISFITASNFVKHESHEKVQSVSENIEEVEKKLVVDHQVSKDIDAAVDSLDSTDSEQIITEDNEIPEEVIEDQVTTADVELEMPVESSEIITDENEEILEQIPNGEIDEKIVEDIEGEEEIVTEEIATVESPDTTSTDLSQYSCLFIDDSVDAQMLFASQMKDFNLLKICSNLTEALPLIKKYNFDLIIVDVNLNDTYNGFDALKIIRQFNNYSDTPIIAVTAYSFEGDKEKFINFGFTDYFVKPLLRNDLIQSLVHVLA